MYRPPLFRDDDPERLAAFAAAHPFATVVATTPDGLAANHVPMLLDRDAGGLVLLGHIARGNDLWRRLPPDAPVLAIFMGADHYVTPSWYATKQKSGEVVPTWNYAVVHAHGRLRFFDDPATAERIVTRLTEAHEHDRAEPWAVADAPRPYIDGLLKAIVCFEIRVERLEGKFKSSQNRDAADRAGVRVGLGAEGIQDAARSELVRDP